MRSCVRFSFLALIVGVIVAVSAPVAQAAEAPAIEKFVATNCTVATCGQEDVSGAFFEPKAKMTVAEAEAEGFMQAGGRVPFGVTDFKIQTVEEGSPTTAPGAYPKQVPTSIVTHLRTDVAPGVATNPFAVTQCKAEQFGNKEAVPGSGFYVAPTCATTGSESTVLGENKVTVYAGAAAKDQALHGTVYNLEPEEGLASEFGVALELPTFLSGGALKAGFEKAEAEGAKAGVGGFPSLAEQKIIEEQQYFAHTLIKGNVEWGQQPNGTQQGDYHDYFEIDISPALPLIRSRLVLEGTKGTGNFITNATACPGHNTTTLKETDKENVVVKSEFTTPVGLMGCNGETDGFGTKFERLPFKPSFSLIPATTANDEPDGVTAEVGIAHNAKETDNSQLKTAVFKLPEGMTLNPSAAAGLTDCTPAQARIHSSAAGMACPPASEIGTVSLEVPTLPPGSLKGSMYLGGPESGPITGSPYIVYLDAESTRYGVSVRIKGEAIPNEATGQITTVFSENPEQPFTKAILHFKEGNLAPVANPLGCGTATTDSGFFPFTETASVGLGSSFTVTGCPASLPFALTQSAQNQTGTAGGHTSYTFNLTRNNGEQYLSQVKTTLPAGLVGAIPIVTPCTEAQAVANTCPAASQIGGATAIAGSGPTPFTFGNGAVYLTGPYNGAPYGMSIVVPAIAGPFNLGPVTARATLNIDPYTDRVTTTSVLPTIVKGIPIRLRGISVAINKQGFLYNPTNCAVSATETTLTSTLGATQNLSSPFQVGNCGALKFKPSFKATTSARTSKANGASLETTINQVAGQANIKSVLVQLPKALPSRLTTLQKACTEAQFAANPFGCPSGSFVGGARANTPLLPGKLTGPAILVSHGGAAFPDLDLVLAANGVRTILVGKTDIKKAITTSNFAVTPDVPVTSITVNLPIGSHSALAANTNLCANPLIMPTTITGQNGVVVKQNTKIAVNGCGVRIVGHKVIGNTAYITVQTFAAGRISGKGASLATVFRGLSSAQKTATLKVPLSRGGSGRRRPFNVKLRVGFVPKAKGGKSSVSFVTVRFS
jgi:hypothetical protein